MARWWVVFVATMVVCSSLNADPSRSLIRMIALGDIAGVKEALDSGANRDFRFQTPEHRSSLYVQSGTPLMLAVELQHLEIVEVLIADGANVNSRHPSGRTALMLASRRDDARIVEVLLNAGSQIDARAEHGVTALMYSAWGNHPANAELLLSRGADVSLRDRFKETALHIASQRGSVDLVEVLVAGGANVNAVSNPRDETPLMLAAGFNNDPEVVSLLLDAGADARMVDSFNHTASLFVDMMSNVDIRQSDVYWRLYEAHY